MIFQHNASRHAETCRRTTSSSSHREACTLNQRMCADVQSECRCCIPAQSQYLSAREPQARHQARGPVVRHVPGHQRVEGPAAHRQVRVHDRVEPATHPATHVGIDRREPCTQARHEDVTYRKGSCAVRILRILEASIEQQAQKRELKTHQSPASATPAVACPAAAAALAEPAAAPAVPAARDRSRLCPL